MHAREADWRSVAGAHSRLTAFIRTIQLQCNNSDVVTSFHGYLAVLSLHKSQAKKASISRAPSHFRGKENFEAKRKFGKKLGDSEEAPPVRLLQCCPSFPLRASPCLVSRKRSQRLLCRLCHLYRLCAVVVVPGGAFRALGPAAASVVLVRSALLLSPRRRLCLGAPYLAQCLQM